MEARFKLEQGRYNLAKESDGKAGNTLEPEPINNTDTEIHGTYGALLFDARWISKRLEILERDQHQCVICKSADKLQVHHRQYHMVRSLGKFKPPWEYSNNLLITLCENCHKRGHSKFKVPIISI